MHDDTFNIAVALDLQRERLERMTRGKEKFEKEPAYSKSIPSRLKTRLETYRSLYNDFLDEHSRLISFTKADERADEPYFKDLMIDTLEDAYVDVVAVILEQQAKIEPPAPAQNPQVVLQPNQNPASIVGLPTQPIPSFSGDYLGWNAFDSFFYKCDRE